MPLPIPIHLKIHDREALSVVNPTLKCKHISTDSRWAPFCICACGAQTGINCVTSSFPFTHQSAACTFLSQIACLCGRRSYQMENAVQCRLHWTQVWHMYLVHNVRTVSHEQTYQSNRDFRYLARYTKIGTGSQNLGQTLNNIDSLYMPACPEKGTKVWLPLQDLAMGFYDMPLGRARH